MVCPPEPQITNINPLFYGSIQRCKKEPACFPNLSLDFHIQYQRCLQLSKTLIPSILLSSYLLQDSVVSSALPKHDLIQQPSLRCYTHLCLYIQNLLNPLSLRSKPNYWTQECLINAQKPLSQNLSILQYEHKTCSSQWHLRRYMLGAPGKIFTPFKGREMHMGK